MDIQSFLRLKGLFGAGANLAQPGLDTYSNSSMTPIPDNTPDNSTNQNLLDQFTPRQDISQAYTSALTNIPERPVPGPMRRLGASLAGLGAGSSAMGISEGQPIGFKFNPAQADLASDKVNYPDYDNQLQDWSNKVKALGLGANEEDRANLGEARRLAGNAERDIKQQAVDIKQQQIDINWAKEKDIFETKKRQASDLVAYHDKQLALAKAKLDKDNRNVDLINAYHQAEINSRNARTEAQTLESEHRLAEAKMQHEKVMAELVSRREQANRETNVTRTYDSATGLPTSQRSVTQPIHQYLTNPDTGEKYDTTGWSASDIANARSRGWR